MVQNPYTSIWSFATNLYDTYPQQWAGGISCLVGMIRIDGQCFRFMGPADMSGSVCPTAMTQISLLVNAT